MANLSRTLTEAIQCHKAGDIERADRLYRETLQKEPDQPYALHMLGVLAHQAGEHQQALEWINRALAIDSNQVGYHFSQGQSLAALGQWDRAITSFHKVLQSRPDFAPAHRQLGDVFFAQEQFESAAQSYQRAIQITPKDAIAFLNYSITLDRQGKQEDALEACREAIELRADWPEAYFHLGNLLFSQGHWAEAEVCFRRVTDRDSRHAEARNNLGNTLREQGRFEEAIQEYQTATECDTTLAEPYSNLGNLYLARGELQLAAQFLSEAVRISPDDVVSQSNLGGALRGIGQLEAAEEACRAALRFQPGYAKAHNNLGTCLISQCRLSEAADAFRLALAHEPDDAMAHSNLLSAMLLDTEYSPEEIFSQHATWGERHGFPADPLPPCSNDQSPDRPLRIGYVSPDFRNHAVAKFFQPILENHASESFETFCYAEVNEPDEVTKKIRQRANHWRDSCGSSDRQLAELIRKDAIDILVDLAGHTLDNRLLAFAYRPAPVQVTYLGYPATTGLRVIDYRLTDAIADPPGCQQWHTETLVRLEPSFLCFSAQQDAPEVTPPPANEVGYVTFGSFNKLGKFNLATARRWAEILRRVPESRLLLKTKPLGDPQTRRRALGMFEQEGIDPQRILLEGHTPSAAQHLEMYSKIDIALDAFPYHGTTTTCDALWMGVPVITLAGETHVSRVGVSLLTSIGHSELIAENDDHYASIAVELARDPKKLTDLRMNLRSKMLSSPLCNASSFTRTLEETYRTMWTQWCPTD